MPYSPLLHAHSGLRWIALLFLLLTVAISLKNWLSKSQEWNKPATTIYKLNTIFIHIQFLLGIVLLFISPKMNFSGDWKANEVIRFFTFQHIPSMIIAVILITVAGAVAKRRAKIPSRHMIIAILNLLALILILTNIPWPGITDIGAGWY